MKNKICSVTMIKAPLKDTLNFVNYHLNIGIDHIYLLFDDPKDEAVKVLSKNKRVTCFRGDAKYWENLMSDPKLIPLLKEMKKGATFSGTKSSQLAKTKDKNELARVEKQELNASHVFNLAKKNGYSWVAHLDSDELVYIKGSLKKLLAETSRSVDAIRLTALEAVPEKYSPDNVFLETTLFKGMGVVSRFYYNHKRLLQKIVPLMRKYEGNISGIYFNGHAAGKSIVNANSKIKMVGIHEPVPRPGNSLNYSFPSNGYLLHFDSCSFSEWRKNCIRKYDGTVIAIAMKKKGVEIFEKFVDAYKKGDEERIRNIYAEKYFISSYKKIIFRSLGLLRRIRVDKKLFLEAKNL